MKTRGLRRRPPLLPRHEADSPLPITAVDIGELAAKLEQIDVIVSRADKRAVALDKTV